MAFDGSAIAQGSDPQHLFDEMDDLITAITTGNEAGVTSGLQGLQRAFTPSSLGSTFRPDTGSLLTLE